ncbi:NACHT domain-containing protein [Lactarius deliciosus]|nr:NACHT domain-containing protein [Lactarius deliciosus]
MNLTQLRASLRKWQSPPDPSANHIIACDRQHEGSATWLFQGPLYTQWKVTGSLLWIHGRPGSGKSVLCSAIINDISAMCEAGVASLGYFYFDMRNLDKISCRSLLSSLLTQLTSRSNPFCDILSRLYKAHDEGARQPSDRALTQCLKEMLALPGQAPVYLIMDALDECPNEDGIPSTREHVLDLIKDLIDLHLPSLHLCVTSRLEFDVKTSLLPLASYDFSLHDQSGQQHDISKYVRAVVYAGGCMRRWRDDEKELIIETLSEKADGM